MGAEHAPDQSREPDRPDLHLVPGGAQQGHEFDLIRELLGSETQHFRELHQELSFEEYFKKVLQNPAALRTAYQRLYDMIIADGVETVTRDGEAVTTYNFFKDPHNNGRNALYGLEKPLHELVSLIGQAAHGLGIEKRFLVMIGPVGSAKSTICRLFKEGLERYSQEKEGALYEIGVIPDPEDKDPETGNPRVQWSPMHDEPMLLLPQTARAQLLDRLNQSRDKKPKLKLRGDLCPETRKWISLLLDQYEGDIQKVLDNHIRVRRVVLSEKDRVGIGTFQPKDPKDQDATELTGDVNYRKLMKYGSESDPRGHDYAGEFEVANRGMLEFIEVLKLETAFLYDLLGASQEQQVKPKKFPQVSIDEVIIGHTNIPEYLRLRSDRAMEAFRDRMVKVFIPYNLRLSNEQRIYERDFTEESVGQHIAPHTIEMAAMVAVLSRLEEPKKAGLTRLDKLMIYDGKQVEAFNGRAGELQDASPDEGLSGLSPRYIQDKLNKALAESDGWVSPFMVLNLLEAGIAENDNLEDDDKEACIDAVATARKELDKIVKREVQSAVSADEELILSTADLYIQHLRAYVQDRKIRNPHTNRLEKPDEQLMRAIEEKLNISIPIRDEFRKSVMQTLGAVAADRRSFDIRRDIPKLYDAVQKYLFDKHKDTLNLGRNPVKGLIDRKTQEKIDIVKQRLIKNFGYTEESAADVLDYAAQIFSRGEASE